jgi:Recombination endonuclease VII
VARRTKEQIEAAKRRSETSWKYRLKREYGLTPDDYWALYEAQGRKCAIARCHATGKTRRLSVEHDHSSGYIRGLACSTHNSWFGRAGDDPAVFESAASYLRTPPAFAVIGKRAVPSQSAASGNIHGGAIDTGSHPEAAAS